MIPKLVLGFNKYSDTEVEIKAQSIVNALTGNPNFPTTIPSLAEMQGYIDAYSTALLAAQTKDKTKVAEKNATRKVMEEGLRTLGLYIMAIAGPDEAKLVSSGFELAKSPAPRPPITMPQNFIVSQGLNSGQLQTSVEKVDGARSYVHEYTPDPLTEDSEWESATSTSRKHLFDELQPGKKFWFRVAAVGINQQIVYTEVQSRIAA